MQRTEKPRANRTAEANQRVVATAAGESGVPCVRRERNCAAAAREREGLKPYAINAADGCAVGRRVLSGSRDGR